MLKKTVIYTDFNNVTQTEDLYFNISKSEMAEMELTTPGGMKQKLEQIGKSNDAKLIVDTFKKLITDAYGKKSDDGKYFIKNEILSKEFTQSAAYDVLFLELIQNPEVLTEFAVGLFPSDTINPNLIPALTNAQG